MVNGPLRTAEYDRERRTLGSIASEHRRAELQNSRCVLAGSGGFTAYGTEPICNVRLCAGHVDRTIKGTKVKYIPVERPSRLDP